PLWGNPHTHLGHALLAKGLPNEALEEFRKGASLGMAADSAQYAFALASAGQPDSARALLRLLTKDVREATHYDMGIAMAYSALGDRDEAFRWLDRMVHVSSSMSFLRAPAMAPLRADPRFANILRKLGLKS
ncbi:MAG: tetratricopeptide repeat protein, partial [Gemmatimonadaceae bacterium]